MIRLFVGLDLPDAVRQRLAALRAGVPGARWMEPETYHITLRFLGELHEDQAADVDAALAELSAPGFELTIAGVGHFGQGHRAHTLWAGVERSPGLVHLQAKVESAVVRAGLPPEGRKLSPHVTLARFREAPAGRLADFAALHAGLRLGPLAVTSFQLFSSHLGRTGASYRVEADYRLD